jgi:hypothetical protein
MKNLGKKNKKKLTLALNSLLNAQFHLGNDPNQLHPSMDSFVIGQIRTKERLAHGKNFNKSTWNSKVTQTEERIKKTSYQSKSLKTFSQYNQISKK